MHLHRVQTNLRNGKTSFLKGTWSYTHLHWAVFYFCRGQVLSQEEKSNGVSRRNKSPTWPGQKNEKANGKVKRSGRRWRVNRSNTSPENGPCMKMTIVWQIRAKLTSSSKNLRWELVHKQDTASITRTKIWFEAGIVQGPQYLPSASSTSYFWPTVSPFSVAGLFYCLF